MNSNKLSQLIHNKELWCLKLLFASQNIVKVTFHAVSTAQPCHYLTIKMMESLHFAIWVATFLDVVTWRNGTMEWL